MITRETPKKLINVSVITLKKFNKKYELAVFPNKLYEYRHDKSVILDSILHSKNIYKNVTTGDMASAQDLELFNLPHNELIRYILDNGYEQKAHATNEYELGAIEKQIINLVQGKVTYLGSYVSDDKLIKAIKSIYTIKNTNPKKQVSKILKELEKIGFERCSFKIISELNSIDIENISNLIKINKDNDFNDYSNYGIKIHNGFILVKSDILPIVLNYCDEKN